MHLLRPDFERLGVANWEMVVLDFDSDPGMKSHSDYLVVGSAVA